MTATTITPTTFRQKMTDVLGLIRFSHTVFALPFALLAAMLAWREVPFQSRQLLGILLCMVFARAAAMAFNRLVDRDYDARNPRTAQRHIPAGKLSPLFVTLFTLGCVAAFVASTLLFLPNPWPLRLSIPVMLFLLGYSYAKRWTAFCHYWLSAALMLSPIATWIAITGQISWIPVSLAAVIFFWVGGFDILYATQDVDFDKSQKLNSLPAKFGVVGSLRIALISHLITIICLFVFWKLSGLGPLFLVAVICVSLLLAYEHWLVRPGDLTRVNTAFFNVNAVISLGLLVAAALDLWFFSAGSVHG
ncbi:UbiA-like polyprenyltransferase [Planctomicrobium sp. SH661]|uniref:UbiA-like polyprenyltransferase n=1 Tax=Planctomicrobium sp. SH661 TaxID=3448124 RepID=UPI003F5C7C1B